MLAALTALSWVNKRGKSFPARLRKLLLGALSKPKADRLQNGSLQIYTELLPQYKQAQGAMAKLLNEVCSLLSLQASKANSHEHCHMSHNPHTNSSAILCFTQICPSKNNYGRLMHNLSSCNQKQCVIFSFDAMQVRHMIFLVDCWTQNVRFQMQCNSVLAFYGVLEFSEHPLWAESSQTAFG